MGDTLVGKTCFLLKWKDDEFHQCIPSIGPSHMSKNVDFQENKINVMIWDIALFNRYQSMIKLFFQETNGSAIFFDLSKPDTLKSTNYFFEDVQEYASTVPLVLIGNKCDLEHEVSDNDIKKFVNKFNAKYFEVSCKTGYNMKEVIDYLVKEAVKKAEENKDCAILKLLTDSDKKNCTIC